MSVWGWSGWCVWWRRWYWWWNWWRISFLALVIMLHCIDASILVEEISQKLWEIFILLKLRLSDTNTTEQLLQFRLTIQLHSKHTKHAVNKMSVKIWLPWQCPSGDDQKNNFRLIINVTVLPTLKIWQWSGLTDCVMNSLTVRPIIAKSIRQKSFTNRYYYYYTRLTALFWDYPGELVPEK